MGFLKKGLTEQINLDVFISPYVCMYFHNFQSDPSGQIISSQSQLELGVRMNCFINFFLFFLYRARVCGLAPKCGEQSWGFELSLFKVLVGSKLKNIPINFCPKISKSYPKLELFLDFSLMPILGPSIGHVKNKVRGSYAPLREFIYFQKQYNMHNL